jgi:succinate-semialdehyde dehydrogenase / glutarate-semialdehyde dehydrogenase
MIGLKSRRNRPDLLRKDGFLAGDWVNQASDLATFDVMHPATGNLIATLPDFGRHKAIRVIERAELAQKEWAARTGKERGSVLSKWLDLILAHVNDLVAILTAEMGKPLAEEKGEVLYGAAYIEWFAEEAKRIYGETIPDHQADKRIVILKQPIGVVASITPWNFPNTKIARKMAPALAVGCAIVAKPAAETPLSALAPAVLAEEAGLPKGLLSILPSTASSEIGQAFCENKRVSKLSFTGSTQVGRVLMRQAADRVIRLSMELGGNAPSIVFDDADLDAAVEVAMISKFRNNGQTCVCANRIYVQSEVYVVFASKLAAVVAGLRVGNGFDAGVTTGPLFSEKVIQKVETHIADATSKGAVLVAGGKRHALGVMFFEPTILSCVTQDMLIATEETFGPVALLFRVDSAAEVISMANDTVYGLAAYFYARDLARVWRVAEALECGMVGINTGTISTDLAPFGGIKQPGQGREGSRHGADDYLEIKYPCLGGTGL